MDNPYLYLNIKPIYRFLSAEVRDAALPTPVDGDLAHLVDSDTLTEYVAGSGWHDC